MQIIRPEDYDVEEIEMDFCSAKNTQFEQLEGYVKNCGTLMGQKCSSSEPSSL